MRRLVAFLEFIKIAYSEAKYPLSRRFPSITLMQGIICPKNYR